MNQRFVIGSVCAVVGAIWLASPPIAAQGEAARPGGASAETPRDAKGHPVLGGIWVATQARIDAVPENYASRLRGRPGGPFATQNSRTINFERDSGIGQRVYPKDTKPYLQA